MAPTDPKNTQKRSTKAEERIKKAREAEKWREDSDEQPTADVGKKPNGKSRYMQKEFYEQPNQL